MLEEKRVKGRTFFRVADAMWLADSDVRISRHAPRPKSVGPAEKWIDVNVAQQVLTAYIGDIPVYTTLVSTGRYGASRTVTGEFRIWAKVSAIAMDNTDEQQDVEDLPESSIDTDEIVSEDVHLYSLHEVPWTQFFFENYAIHGVYWHDRFGNRKSHGCVNMAPLDARWLFNWTEPGLPPGWWAIHAASASEGTLVRVR